MFRISECVKYVKKQIPAVREGIYCYRGDRYCTGSARRDAN